MYVLSLLQVETDLRRQRQNLDDGRRNLPGYPLLYAQKVALVADVALRPQADFILGANQFGDNSEDSLSAQDATREDVFRVHVPDHRRQGLGGAIVPHHGERRNNRKASMDASQLRDHLIG